jgi:hypothetical protein
MTAQLIPISKLVLCPPEKNPNKMTDAEYALLKDAMAAASKNGDEVLQTVLLSPHDPPADTFDVVDGNHRVQAAIELGWTDMLAIVRAMTPNEIIAYRLGMNRNRGRIDLTIAKGQLSDLVLDGDVALEVTGFTGEEITDLTTPVHHERNLLADAGSTDVEGEATPSAKPFVLEIPFTKKSDYQLARRKLRKAAGKTKDLARGLLAVLGEDTP